MTERIKDLISFLGLSTRAFALKCGIRQNTLSNQLNGVRELSLQTVVAILTTFDDVSSDWLIKGEGEMFKQDLSSKESERINKLVDTITTLQDTINDKNKGVNSLSDRIKQLENRLNTK